MTFDLIKRQLIKRGKLAHLLWPLIGNGLYCFNFHRIGDALTTPFDPCVFSCDANSFEQYIDFIQNNFRVINLAELNHIISGKRPIKEKLALITFDDGYLDNYQIAYPVLKKRGIQGTFFIPTSMIESNKIPWWDEIAWLVKQCAGKELKLSSWLNSISIEEPVNNQSIKNVLKIIKNTPVRIERQIQELREIAACSIPSNLIENLFVNSTQIAEMHQNGMAIGGHSHSHNILSSLASEELQYELAHSKKLLEDIINTPITAMSYPVGGRDTYTREMFKVLKTQGYTCAFSFVKSSNKNVANNPFEIARFSIDGKFDPHELKLAILCSESIN